MEELRQLHVGKNREAQGWLAKARDAHGEGRAHYSMIIRMFSLTQDLVEGIAGSESFSRLKVPRGQGATSVPQSPSVTLCHPHQPLSTTVC